MNGEIAPQEKFVPLEADEAEEAEEGAVEGRVPSRSKPRRKPAKKPSPRRDAEDDPLFPAGPQ